MKHLDKTLLVDLAIFLALLVVVLIMTGCAAPAAAPQAPLKCPVPVITDMGPVPRVDTTKPLDAGDVLGLTLDLYAYAGECRRRLHALQPPPENAPPP